MPKPRQAIDKKAIIKKTTKNGRTIKVALKKKTMPLSSKKAKSVKIPEEFIVKDYQLVKPQRTVDFRKAVNSIKGILNIKKMALRLLSILLIVGMNFGGISLVAQAFFADFELAPEMGLGIATLDFALRSDSQNFIPTTTAISLTPGDQVVRNIYLTKNGSADFKYQASSALINGDTDLYNSLFLNIWYTWYDGAPSSPDYLDHKNRDLKYAGLLTNFTDFDTQPDLDLIVENSKIYYTNPFYGPNEHWLEFQITLPSSVGSNLQSTSIEFKFNFEAQQITTSGFDDQESMLNSLTAGSWGVVLNEFLPNPLGNENSLSGPDGEWIEIHNLSSNSSHDLVGYYLTDSDPAHIIEIEGCRTHTGLTTIPSSGFLVVYTRGTGNCTTHGLTLGNNGDSINLYDPSDNLIDSYTYDLDSYCNLTPTPGQGNNNDSSGDCPTEVPEGKSYARIPDGTGEWVDPVPTPGGTNAISENLILLSLHNQPPADDVTPPINSYQPTASTHTTATSSTTPILVSDSLNDFNNLSPTSTPTTTLLIDNQIIDQNIFIGSTSTPTTTLGVQCYIEDQQGNLILETDSLVGNTFSSSTSTSTTTPEEIEQPAHPAGGLEVINSEDNQEAYIEDVELLNIQEGAQNIDNVENNNTQKEDVQQLDLKLEDELLVEESAEQNSPNTEDDIKQQNIKQEDSLDNLSCGQPDNSGDTTSP